MPLEALVVALLGLVLSAQGAVWYKLGRVETKLDGHLKHAHREE